MNLRDQDYLRPDQRQRIPLPELNSCPGSESERQVAAPMNAAEAVLPANPGATNADSAISPTITPAIPPTTRNAATILKLNKAFFSWFFIYFGLQLPFIARHHSASATVASPENFPPALPASFHTNSWSSAGTKVFREIAVDIDLPEQRASRQDWNHNFRFHQLRACHVTRIGRHIV